MHDHDMKKPQVATRSVGGSPTSAPPRRRTRWWAKIKHARMHLNTVPSPDRTGARRRRCGGRGAGRNLIVCAEAEIYSPAAGSARTTYPRVARLYHSVALLPPDGKVITAGSNPHRGVEELRIEVFSPPYLFKGARPALSLADSLPPPVPRSRRRPPPTCARSTSARRPATPHAPPTASSAAPLLSKSPARPHRAHAADNSNLAPPGWYMVFAVSTGGVPSMAQWLHLQSQ